MMTAQGLHACIAAYAAHHGNADVLSTQVACRWASPEMAMKYARQTGGMGLRMVQELARDLAEGWDPLMKDAPIVSFGGRDRGQQPKGAPLLPADLAPEMLQLIDELEPVNCVLRDGSTYRGIVRSFGRWDMSIEVEEAGEVTILFHALHKSNTWAL